MADTSNLKLAIDLLLDSGRQIQSWMTRFMAINAALLSGIGLIVGWAKFDDYKLVMLLILVAICLFGAFASFFIGGVTIRQIRWNREYRNRVRAAQDKDARVMPEESEVSGGSFNINFVSTMRWLVPVLWIGLGATIGCTLAR